MAFWPLMPPANTTGARPANWRNTCQPPNVSPPSGPFESTKGLAIQLPVEASKERNLRSSSQSQEPQEDCHQDCVRITTIWKH